jgi:mannosyltransferase
VLGTSGKSEGVKVATATAIERDIEKPARVFSKLVYPVALLASLSIWLLALRAPLWLDETLAYWQVSGGFWKIWSRSQMMPSSIGYLYMLWAAKSILGSQEIALKIPSTLAMLGAVYFLFRAARELFDRDIAFLVCIFFALEPNVVFAATDARPYAFALLATNFAIFAFVLWMKRHEMRQAILFGAGAAAILYFHYLFGAILPAFAIYYLAVRRHSIKADARQLAAVLISFTLLILPLMYRLLSLYHTRETHVVQELPHSALAALNTLAPMQKIGRAHV